MKQLHSNEGTADISH